MAFIYGLVDPDGALHNVIGLRVFCRENNLNSCNMDQVAKGNLNQYKGWTIPSDNKYNSILVENNYQWLT